MNNIQQDNVIPIKENKIIFQDMLDLPYDSFVQKYGQEIFETNVFSYSMDSEAILLRDFMAEDFFENQQITLSSQQKDSIIAILATNQETDNNGIEQKLKEVISTAALPENFDPADYRERASKILNAMGTLKKVIAENQVDEYITNVQFFLKFTHEQLGDFQKEATSVSERFSIEYEKSADKHLPPSPAVIDQTVDFIQKCGRTSLAATSLKDKKNLGDIAELLGKIDLAIKIADGVRVENPNSIDASNITTEIKKQLMNQIHM